MSVLEQKTEKYAYPSYFWQEDGHGFYFSDASIDPFVAEARQVLKGVFEMHLFADAADSGLSPLNRHRLLIPEPQLSWEESCALVVAAFEKFDPRLGEKAREVINDIARWKLNQVSSGEAVGLCNPANCESNQNPFAVIEYDYEGTINDAVYIAHELGHLIADDYINEAGFSHGDVKWHMFEIQAFFVQHILYDFLSTHPDPELRQVGQKHFIGEITRSLYALPIGTGALEAEKVAVAGGQESEIQNTYETVMREWLGGNWKKYEKAERLSNNILDARKRDGWGICELHQHSMAAIVSAGLFVHVGSQGQSERARMMDALLGKEGPIGINEIYEIAGLGTKADIQVVAEKAIKHIIKPLEMLNSASEREFLPMRGPQPPTFNL